LPGDATHTFITLAKPLEYCYFRDTVVIYGNVVKATHGETRKEKLGSGDATTAFQRFSLSQSPLTFVASPTPAGAASTLKVYVNEVQWHEVDSLVDAGPSDREFVTKTDDAAKTSVTFGNGVRGARLPTGTENVRAEYRSGIGAAANVKASQITQLISKPLGVKGVTNPLRASGGADRESMNTARKNAPLTVTALDRLISVPDYADFARTFAGIGKSASAMVTDGKRLWVHVTIAGADDIPIDESSDLFRNLLEALRDFGDPNQAVALQVRELFLLAVAMNVRILPDYEWDPVVGSLRSGMLDRFSFERQELGQPIYLSDVVATAQSVAGVEYVEVTACGGIPEKKADVDSQGDPIRRLLTPQEISDAVAAFVSQAKTPAALPWRIRVQLAGFDSGTMRPAQLAYLTPTVADTLVVNQIK
jgi:predicted phage baseplate assembly protein